MEPIKPMVIGPYSPIYKAGDFLFCSGQIPLDTATGKLISGDIEALTTQVLENLRAVLKTENAQLENIVKTTIFLKNLEDFKKVNEVYKTFFKIPYPARSTIEVSQLPMGADIEIEAIAYLKSR